MNHKSHQDMPATIMGRPDNSDIELKIVWKSDHATHTERHYFQQLNRLQDHLPGKLGNKFLNAAGDEWITETIAASDIIPAFDQSNIITLPLDIIHPVGRAKTRITPQQGRFYPRRIIAGSAGITRDDLLPLRVIAVDRESFTVDMNHPLTRHQFEISVRGNGEGSTEKEKHEDLGEGILYQALMSGIGLQLPMTGGTNFYADGAFRRMDETNDAGFYAPDRLVNHIDSTASRLLTEFYSRHIKQGMQVLDLMSSWQSHLPENIGDLQVTGLGMNGNEMSANPLLDRHVIHDLNEDTKLPFTDNSFDVAVCSLSIEYLIDPLAVMRELVRVTRPHGSIMVSFSDRWFPPKAIMIWQELHPFERLGMALDYYLKTDGLNNLQTETVQGLLRPEDDKYATTMLHSDPLFMISANVTD